MNLYRIRAYVMIIILWYAFLGIDYDIICNHGVISNLNTANIIIGIFAFIIFNMGGVVITKLVFNLLKSEETYLVDGKDTRND